MRLQRILLDPNSAGGGFGAPTINPGTGTSSLPAMSPPNMGPSIINPGAPSQSSSPPSLPPNNYQPYQPGSGISPMPQQPYATQYAPPGQPPTPSAFQVGNLNLPPYQSSQLPSQPYPPAPTSISPEQPPPYGQQPQQPPLQPGQQPQPQAPPGFQGLAAASQQQQFQQQPPAQGQQQQPAQTEPNYYEQLGRQLAFQQGQQQQQPKSQPQRPAWAPPEFDRRWMAVVEQDKDTGKFRSKPGYDPTIGLKVQQFADYQSDFENRFMENPYEALRPGLVPMIQQVAQQLFQQQQSAHQDRQYAEQVKAANSGWLYQKNQDGSIARDQRGQEILSTPGKQFVGYLQEAVKSGLRTVQQQERYAMAMLENDLLRRVTSQQQPAPQPQNPWGNAQPYGQQQGFFPQNPQPSSQAPPFVPQQLPVSPFVPQAPAPFGQTPAPYPGPYSAPNYTPNFPVPPQSGEGLSLQQMLTQNAQRLGAF